MERCENHDRADARYAYWQRQLVTAATAGLAIAQTLATASCSDRSSSRRSATQYRNDSNDGIIDITKDCYN